MGIRFETQKKILGLLTLVLVSRLPFIFTGAGADADAWRILLTGHSLVTNGIYHASRLPGYPVPEVISSIFWLCNFGTGGYWVINLLTAILSTVAVYFFYKILAVCFPGRDNVNLGASLAFAFTPVFYIASTTAMDYVWAIAGVLAAVYYVLNNRYTTSALVLAVATGCRLTSGLFLLLIILFLLPKDRKIIVKFIAIYAAIVLLLFSPLWTRLGFGFLRYEVEVYPSITSILGRAFIRVWGITGSLGLLLGVITIIVQKKKLVLPNVSGNTHLQKNILYLSGFAIFFYALLFLRIPMDGGYLIPAIPFVIFILSRFVQGRSIYVVLGCFVISSFVLDIHENKIIMQGSIFSDYSGRKNEMEYAKEVLLTKSNDRTPEIIICKAHLPVISVIRFKSGIKIPPEKHFIYEISDDTVKFNPNIDPVTVSYLRDCN